MAKNMSLMVLVLAIIIVFFGAVLNQSNSFYPQNGYDEFCGWSTYDHCISDSDCIKGGCSGQVCHSRNENIITTCEWRNCYDSSKYELGCRCVNNTCKWSK